MDKNFAIKQKRAIAMANILQKHDPHAHIALKYGNPMQLLAAVIMSAQETDKKVNEITDRIFSARGGSASGGKKYKTVNDFADADLKTFEQEIKQIGFYHAKAKNVIAAAKKIRDEYHGKIPKTMEEATALPGVGRKTANIVLGILYGLREGIAVDTHVRRLSQHFGWTKQKTPEKIEQDLMKLFPREYWLLLPYLLVDYGRTICTARKCRCKEFYLKDFMQNPSKARK